MGFLRNEEGQIGSLQVLVGVSILLLVLGAVFLVGPLVFDKMQGAADYAEPVAATGTLTFSGAVSDGELVNISSDTYEFDTEGNTTTGNLVVDVSISTNQTYSASQLTDEINANGTVGVSATVDSNIVTVTADTPGASGNSITTTENVANASWSSSTLTGGDDGSRWNPETNTDITSAHDIWSYSSLIGLVVLVALVSMAIYYLRSMGGGF